MALTLDGSIKLDKKFYGQKTTIFAQSGYGKSYAARVIIEEAKEVGVSILILDPQDAYLNLPDFEYINAEDVKNIANLGVLLARTNRNTVIRLRKLSDEMQPVFVNKILASYRKVARKGIQTIIIDEAHKFAPETQKTASKDIVRGMFQEDRSYGIGAIAITQRLARMDKTILSQSNNLMLGRVSSSVDKKAMGDYLSDKSEVDKIKELEVGDFYLVGFGNKEPVVVKVRKAKTEHSGNSPENVLDERKEIFRAYKGKIVKNNNKNSKGVNMDDIDTKNEPLNKLVPSASGFSDLAMKGAKMGIGAAVGGVAGAMLGSRFASPIPVVSSRTLGSGLTTVALYAGYRNVGNSTLKEILEYGAAGSAAFTLGSLTADVLGVMNVQIPSPIMGIVGAATGIVSDRASEDSAVDLDTKFA